MCEIKLITPNTKIPKLTPMDWDVEINERPYYVAHIPGYVHTLRGWGEPIDLWAWPRGETPSYDNLLTYDCREPIMWTFSFTEARRNGWDHEEPCVKCSSATTIFRNDELFYRVPGKMEYSVPKAITIINGIYDHPLSFQSIDFEKKACGRKIWYYNTPAYIDHYVSRRGEVVICPETGYKFTPLKSQEKWWDDEYRDSLVIDVFESPGINWFRD